MKDSTLELIRHHYQARTVNVVYQDVANPIRFGTVVEHRAGEFRITWDDEEGGETWSDLRQAGWSKGQDFPFITVNCTHGVHRICGGYVAPLVYANYRPCGCPCHTVGLDGKLDGKPFMQRTKILVGDTIESYNERVRGGG